MKAFSFSLVALVVAGCSTVAPTPPQTAPVALTAKVSQFPQTEVNEAASAYVSTYAEAVHKTVSERRYQQSLTLRHLNAESCLDSRAARLMKKELTQQEKEAMVLAYVSKEKLAEYQSLSAGYMLRPNGLEVFSCANAGLTVASNGFKY